MTQVGHHTHGQRMAHKKLMAGIKNTEPQIQNGTPDARQGDSHWKQEAQSPKSLTPKKAMARKPRQDLIHEPIVREVRECIDSAGTSD